MPLPAMSDLKRYLSAQNTGVTYERALAELRGGRKRSHWIWFVLPQLQGLGRSAMAQRYGIDDVHVAVADAEGEDPASPSRVQVTLRRHGAGGSPQLQVQSFAADGQADALGRAVAEINRETQEAWKRETLIRFDREQRLSASVPLQDLADWVDIRRRLSRVSLIQRHELTAMTGKDAQVVLYYWGEPSRLALALAQASLELTEETGGFWSLRRPGRAAP